LVGRASEVWGWGGSTPGEGGEAVVAEGEAAEAAGEGGSAAAAAAVLVAPKARLELEVAEEAGWEPLQPHPLQPQLKPLLLLLPPRHLTTALRLLARRELRRRPVERGEQGCHRLLCSPL